MSFCNLKGFQEKYLRDMTQNPTSVKITWSNLWLKSLPRNHLGQWAENRSVVVLVIIEIPCNSRVESEQMQWVKSIYVRASDTRSRYSNRTVTLIEHSIRLSVNSHELYLMTFSLLHFNLSYWMTFNLAEFWNWMFAKVKKKDFQ